MQYIAMAGELRAIQAVLPGAHAEDPMPVQSHSENDNKVPGTSAVTVNTDNTVVVIEEEEIVVVIEGELVPVQATTIRVGKEAAEEQITLL